MADESSGYQRGERGERGGGRAPARRRRVGTAAPRGRKVCAYCVDGVKEIDYKQADALRRFITERGQIRPQRKTALCAKHQRRLALAVKRARYMALLPYTSEHMRLYG